MKSIDSIDFAIKNNLYSFENAVTKSEKFFEGLKYFRCVGNVAIDFCNQAEGFVVLSDEYLSTKTLWHSKQLLYKIVRGLSTIRLVGFTRRVCDSKAMSTSLESILDPLIE